MSAGKSSELLLARTQPLLVFALASNWGLFLGSPVLVLKNVLESLLDHLRRGLELFLRTCFNVFHSIFFKVFESLVPYLLLFRLLSNLSFHFLLGFFTMFLGQTLYFLLSKFRFMGTLYFTY